MNKQAKIKALEGRISALESKLKKSASTGWAILIFKPKYVEFSITRPEDLEGEELNGTQPYGRDPMKAILYVFGLIKKNKIPPSAVQVIH
jgi:hypothetical protein